MLSLPQVLYEAQRHAVEEIAIEPGEPVTFHGEDGALVLGDPLDDADVSEALSQVLAPEQQAELAVAGVVEFYVQGYAQWSLVAETGEDGVMIRGYVREGDSPSEVGVPLELPPLQPFRPERGADAPPAPGSVLRRSVRQATRWDMGTADVLDVDGEPATLEPDEPYPEPVYGARGSRSMLEEDEAIDFALVGRTGPEAPAEYSEPGRGTRGLDAQLSAEVTAPRPTRSKSAITGSLAAHAESLEAGMLVYVAGLGLAEGLLDHLDDGYMILDQDSWATITTMPLPDLPVGRGYLVRLEDPSRCLPWLLRRLEEGARVVVEGRARTPAGARRILLGAEAGPHLERWLDAHPQKWLSRVGVTWRLESF